MCTLRFLHSQRMVFFLLFNNHLNQVSTYFGGLIYINYLKNSPHTCAEQVWHICFLISDFIGRRCKSYCSPRSFSLSFHSYCVNYTGFSRIWMVGDYNSPLYRYAILYPMKRCYYYCILYNNKKCVIFFSTLRISIKTSPYWNILELFKFYLKCLGFFLL